MIDQGMQDDFKRDGFVSQLMERIAELEAFEREFRLKQFGAGGGGDCVLIASSTLGADAANIDFSAIPATYSSLRIIGYVRGKVAATSTSLIMLYNGDGGANYDFVQTAERHSGTFTTAEGIAINLPVVGYVTGNTSPANVFGVVDIVIPQYANTSNHKSALTNAHGMFAASTTNIYIGHGNTRWRNTAAINQITFSDAAGSNLAAGSSIQLYGFT